jgi:signal peptidase II
VGTKFKEAIVSRKDIMYWVVLPLIGCWLVDFLSQAGAGSLKEPWFIGLMGLVPVRETSFLLGGVTDLPVTLINTAAVSLAAFLTFIYVILQWSMATRSVMFRLGLSVFLGGVLGHATQRVCNGNVVSFITFGTPHLNTPPFNLGDIFQMFGIALCFAGSWRDTGTIWPYRNVRASFSYWVNPKFQIRHCVTILIGGFMFALASGLFGYFFLKGALLSSGVAEPIVDKLLWAFLVTQILLSVSFLGALFFVGLVQSHRIIGPIYAFERFLEDLFQGKARKLKLRNGDQFKQLEKMADDLVERLGTKPPDGERKSA